MKKWDQKTLAAFHVQVKTNFSQLAKTCATLNDLTTEYTNLHNQFALLPETLKTTKEAQVLTKLFTKHANWEQELRLMQKPKQQIQKLLAELENQRKRHQHDLTISHTQTQKVLLKEILKSVDLFELSLNFKTHHAETKTFLEGMKMVYELFLKTLTSFNVQVLPLKIGDRYNFHRHEALKVIYDKTKPDQTILSIEQKGYLLDNDLLRQAKVIINQYPAPKTIADSKLNQTTEGEKKNE